MPKKAKMKGLGLPANVLQDFIQLSYSPQTRAPDGFELDEELSDSRVKVYTKDNSKEVVVVHRGSVGADDWIDNAKYFAFGSVKNTKTFKLHKERQLKAIEKYGANNIIGVGHSRAGLYLQALQKDYPIKEIITYNKAVGFYDMLRTNPKEQTDVKVKNDFVSLLSGLQKRPNAMVEIDATANPLDFNKAHQPKELEKLGTTFIGLKDEKEGGALTKEALGKLSKKDLFKLNELYSKDFKKQLKKKVEDTKKGGGLDTLGKMIYSGFSNLGENWRIENEARKVLDGVKVWHLPFWKPADHITEQEAQERVEARRKELGVEALRDKISNEVGFDIRTMNNNKALGIATSGALDALTYTPLGIGTSALASTASQLIDSKMARDQEAEENRLAQQGGAIKRKRGRPPKIKEGNGFNFNKEELTNIILHKNKVIADLEEKAYDVKKKRGRPMKGGGTPEENKANREAREAQERAIPEELKPEFEKLKTQRNFETLRKKFFEFNYDNLRRFEKPDYDKLSPEQKVYVRTLGNPATNRMAFLQAFQYLDTPEKIRQREEWKREKAETERLWREANPTKDPKSFFTGNNRVSLKEFGDFASKGLLSVAGVAETLATPINPLPFSIVDTISGLTGITTHQKDLGNALRQQQAEDGKQESIGQSVAMSILGAGIAPKPRTLEELKKKLKALENKLDKINKGKVYKTTNKDKVSYEISYTKARIINHETKGEDLIITKKKKYGNELPAKAKPYKPKPKKKPKAPEPKKEENKLDFLKLGTNYTKMDFSKAVNNYIRTNNLQTKTNEREFRIDKNLSKLFNIEENKLITYFQAGTLFKPTIIELFGEEPKPEPPKAPEPKKEEPKKSKYKYEDIIEELDTSSFPIMVYQSKELKSWIDWLEKLLTNKNKQNSIIRPQLYLANEQAKQLLNEMVDYWANSVGTHATKIIELIDNGTKNLIEYLGYEGDQYGNISLYYTPLNASNRKILAQVFKDAKVDVFKEEPPKAPEPEPKPEPPKAPKPKKEEPKKKEPKKEENILLEELKTIILNKDIYDINELLNSMAFGGFSVKGKTEKGRIASFNKLKKYIASKTKNTKIFNIEEFITRFNKENCKDLMCKYNINSKADFRKWVAINHPDKGGTINDTDFKQIVKCGIKEKYCKELEMKVIDIEPEKPKPKVPKPKAPDPLLITYKEEEIELPEPEPTKKPIEPLINKLEKKIEEFEKVGREHGAVIYDATTFIQIVAYIALLMEYEAKCAILGDKEADNIRINSKLRSPMNKEFYEKAEELSGDLLDCIEREDKLIAIPLSLRFGSKKDGHANLLIYRPFEKTIERFEPHGNEFQGSEGQDADKVFNSVLTRMFEVEMKPYLKEYTPKFISPDQICPNPKGFQSLEDKVQSLKQEGGGFCGMWSLFILELLFINPTKPTAEIIKEALAISKEDPQYLRNVIRGYVKKTERLLNDYVKKIDANDGFTFAKGKDLYYNKKIAFQEKLLELLLSFGGKSSQVKKIQKEITTRKEQENKYKDLTDLLETKSLNEINDMMSAIFKSNGFSNKWRIADIIKNIIRKVEGVGRPDDMQEEYKKKVIDYFDVSQY